MVLINASVKSPNVDSAHTKICSLQLNHNIYIYIDSSFIYQNVYNHIAFLL